MKAELDANGKLSVIAETPLEAFALGIWWDAFMEIARPVQRPVLHVDTESAPLHRGDGAAGHGE